MRLFDWLLESQTQTQTESVFDLLRENSPQMRCLALSPRGASRLSADLQPVLTLDVLSCSYGSDFKQIMKYPRNPSDLH